MTSALIPTPSTGLHLTQDAVNLFPYPKYTTRYNNYLSGRTFPTNCTKSASTTVWHTPGSALLFTCTGGSIPSATYSSLMLPATGTWVTFSAWIKATDATGTGYASCGTIKPTCGNLSNITQVGYNAATTNGWQRVSCTGKVQYGTNAALLTLFAATATAAAGDCIYIDDIQLEVGTGATDYLHGNMGGNYSWLAAVPTPALVTNTSGGSIAAGSYYVVVTALGAAGGESLANTEVAAVNLSGSTNSLTVSGYAVAGAASYNIYVAKRLDAGWQVTNTSSTSAVISAYAAGTAQLPTSDSSGIAGVPFVSASRRVGAVSSGVYSAAVLGDLTITGRHHGFNVPFINVRDPLYNAQGDGVTDDSAAIQAAANAAAATGARLFLPAGTYACKSQITFTCHVQGEGMADTVIKYIGSTIGNLASYLTQLGGIDLSGPAGGGQYSNACLASSFVVLSGQRDTVSLQDLTVLGTLTAASFAAKGSGNSYDSRPRYPSGIYAFGTPYINRVTVTGFDAGIIVLAYGGHWHISNTVFTVCWYGVYLFVDGFDGVMEYCELVTSIAFAAIAFPGYPTSANCAPIGSLFYRVHIASTLYGFYQEFNTGNAAFATTSDIRSYMFNTTWFSGTVMDIVHMEFMGCGYIYSEMAALDLYGPTAVLQPGLTTAFAYTKAVGATVVGGMMYDTKITDAKWSHGLITQDYGRAADYGIVASGMEGVIYEKEAPTDWPWALGTIWIGGVAPGSGILLLNGKYNNQLSIAVADGRFYASIRMRNREEERIAGIATIGAGASSVTISLIGDSSGIIATPGVPFAYTDTASAGAHVGTSPSQVTDTSTLPVTITPMSVTGDGVGFILVVTSVSCTQSGTTGTGMGTTIVVSAYKTADMTPYVVPTGKSLSFAWRIG